MNATPTTAPADPSAAPGVGPDDLRLVLFGLPAAGKTSLLGALGQAAESQEHLLGGKLADESGGLREMRRQLYETAGKRTPEEVVPYPVRYEPAGGRPADAVIMDCDGRVASELMAKERIAGTAPGVTLAGEVADADALLLVTDASAPPAQLEKDFHEFDRFLDEMEKARGERTEVGGLPVFLVLTKCDLLARAEDSAADWMDRIEQRKADADAKFRAFMARRQATKEGSPAPGFGRLDLRVWATAVKRPALLGTAPKPREPYGVAELFRQALGGASAYRASAERSDRALHWLVGLGAVLVLGVLVLAAASLFLAQGAAANDLIAEAERLRFGDKDTPAERLRGTVEEVRRRLGKFAAVREAQGFDTLPDVLRGFVRERHSELSRYVAWYEKVLEVKSPAFERSDEGLEKIRERLRTELAPPEEAWEGTPAARRRQDHLETADAVRAAVRTARNWHLDSSDQAGKLLAFADHRSKDGLDFAGWAVEAEKLLDPARKPPFSPEDELPGAPGLTWGGTVLRFDSVAQAQSAWAADREQMSRAFDAAAALGLVPGRMGLLVFPRTFALKSSKERLDALKAALPDFEKRLASKEMPEAARSALGRAARAQYENLLVPARGEVLANLRRGGLGREETPGRWDEVRKWIARPVELAAWRELAMALLRLEKEKPADPVEALAEFLERKSFTIKARTLVLELPNALKPVADATLAVFHDGKRALAYKQAGAGAKGEGGRTVRYTFRLDEGVEIAYRPGDALRAELPLSGGKAMVWNDSRSLVWQFEKLSRLPNVEGRVADEAKLEWRGDDGPPPVPDLVPDPVRLVE
ncbi:MAG: hypothetical protein K2W96_13895 [Gemmataceae bacterium]|nr:hypothetical protein [Gemmataceae bacterium]